MARGGFGDSLMEPQNRGANRPRAAATDLAQQTALILRQLHSSRKLLAGPPNDSCVQPLICRLHRRFFGIRQIALARPHATTEDCLMLLEATVIAGIPTHPNDLMGD